MAKKILELDHVFICSSSLDADANALNAFGLQLGGSFIHSGQGTASKCFFFNNAYLELLGLHNQEEVQSKIVRPTRLWERLHWRESKACHFGISFRYIAGAINTSFPLGWQNAGISSRKPLKLPINTQLRKTKIDR